MDLDAVAAGIQALNVDLLAVQEVGRTLADSGRADQPALIAQALGVGWFRSYAPALVGDDFRPLAGPDPGGPADGNLLVSRLPLAEVEQLRFPPTGGGEQRTALLASIQVGARPVTVAATHLSNKRGHNLRQLRELQQLAGSRVAPRLLVGDLNLPSTVVVASRRGWPEIGGRTWPNSHPTQQLDHVLWNNPAGWSALVAPHVCRDSGACSPGLDPPVVSVGSLRETRSARGLPWRPRTSNRKSVAERWDVPSGWLLAQRRGDSHQAGARQGRGPEGPPGEGGTAFRRCADRAGRRGMVDGSWASQA